MKTIEYRHNDRVWHIPADLVEAQRRWDSADKAVTALSDPGSPAGPEALNAARKARQDWTMTLVHHPWTIARQREGLGPAVEQARKELAREGRQA